MTPRTSSAHAFTQADSTALMQRTDAPQCHDRGILDWAKRLSKQEDTPRVHLVIDQRHYLYQRGHLVATSTRRDG